MRLCITCDEQGLNVEAYRDGYCDAHLPMTCDQCAWCRINGHFSHEQGCPNDGKRFEGGEWVKYYECRECGCDVREGVFCNCDDYDEDCIPEDHFFHGEPGYGFQIVDRSRS